MRTASLMLVGFAALGGCVPSESESRLEAVVARDSLRDASPPPFDQIVAAAPLDSMGRAPGGARLSPDSVAALAAAVDTSASGTVQVLSGVGVFHGDEVAARDGERWQGLYPNGELYSFPLRVTPALDPVLDKPGGPRTGIEVTTPRSTVYDDSAFDDATILLRRPGRPFHAQLVTVLEDPWPIDSGRLPLSLDDRDYTLDVVEGPEGGRDSQGNPYRVERVLVLASGDLRQPVSDLATRDDGHPAILWAGDLDGDGQLDLVIDESTHYNATSEALFLSSEARRGELVRRVARHDTVGC